MRTEVWLWFAHASLACISTQPPEPCRAWRPPHSRAPPWASPFVCPPGDNGWASHCQIFSCCSLCSVVLPGILGPVWRLLRLPAGPLLPGLSSLCVLCPATLVIAELQLAAWAQAPQFLFFPGLPCILPLTLSFGIIPDFCLNMSVSCLGWPLPAVSCCPMPWASHTYTPRPAPLLGNAQAVIVICLSSHQGPWCKSQSHPFFHGPIQTLSLLVLTPQISAIIISTDFPQEHGTVQGASWKPAPSIIHSAMLYAVHPHHSRAWLLPKTQVGPWVLLGSVTPGRWQHWSPPLLPRCWPAMLQHPDFQGHLLATSQHISHGVSAVRTGEILSKVRKLQMYSPSFLEVEETWRCTWLKEAHKGERLFLCCSSHVFAQGAGCWVTYL